MVTDNLMTTTVLAFYLLNPPNFKMEGQGCFGLLTVHRTIIGVPSIIGMAPAALS